MKERSIYKNILYPLLFFRVDAEATHDVAVEILRWTQNFNLTTKILERTLCFKGKRFLDKRLHTEVNGVNFENPVILAAGFDKNGKCFSSMYSLGFSSIVVGTVVENAQAGNKKPRIFHIKDSLINSMGFPSKGAEFVAREIMRHDHTFPLGISLGLNKDTSHSRAPEKYALLSKYFEELADYFEINVSSPNTTGLRDLQQKEPLEDIVKSIRDITKKPLFIKISPDQNQNDIDDIIQIATDHKLAIVATNTTTSPIIKKSLGKKWMNLPGGVSGASLFDKSLKIISHIYKISDVDIVGAGGIKDLHSLLKMIAGGAKAVQIYTGLITEGPALPSKLNHQLSAWMQNKGISSIDEIRGEKI